MAACVCGGLALISGFLDVSAVLRMFVPWHTHPVVEVPASPTGKPAPATPPRVHWELFRLFNWLTSVTFLFCVAHLASVQRSGLSILFHSRLVVLVCCLCLVREMGNGTSGQPHSTQHPSSHARTHAIS